MSGKTPFKMIEEGPEYELFASEDEAAFVLRFKPDRMNAHLIDDDALRFYADYKALKLQFPAWTADQTLAQLWDQGGYSWLAAQEKC
ncbi:MULTISPECIES: hypothetical protein [unclassified Hyphomicrobium]|uniref:hypothetical protein n=1 Tax=unclassified Hyphomicrobium TaxID=2619925 RepID=UPI000213D62F|nr:MULTISPECIES: hypothetical protein [unclassified Hyphomicrobium]CCB66886.1 conserved protein of unknown function [Hyphomicrobium sp. MC1]